MGGVNIVLEQSENIFKLTDSIKIIKSFEQTIGLNKYPNKIDFAQKNRIA